MAKKREEECTLLGYLGGNVCVLYLEWGEGEGEGRRLGLYLGLLILGCC